MENIILLIILLTVVTSIVGFGNRAFFDRYKFNIGAILEGKQWDRMLSSAFLHGDYLHLILNMYAFYIFSSIVLNAFGIWMFLGIYFGSVIGGSLLALLMHKREYYYSAIGASGGVVGILFASIAIFPQMQIGIFLIPFRVEGWIFGIIYLGFSIYGMRSKQGNIGHDAHLGGAAVGLLLSLLFAPSLFFENFLYIGLLSIPLFVLMYYVWKSKNK